MHPIQLRRVSQAARMRDHLQVPLESEGVVANADALVGGIESSLQPPTLRRDARGAGVGMAAHGLDTAERKHESPSDVDQIGAQRDVGGDVRAGGDLA
jgi:hypothetical protein